MVGAHGRGTSYQHESSGSGGGSSRLPTPQTGNMITHTHSHYTHTPKDIIRTQKINLLGKKGKNVQLQASYRPISILQVLYKMYTSLILQRLSSGMKDRIWKFQYGFQSGFSVDDAIFGILRILETAHNLVGMPVYLLLLDWSRAYDRVHIPHMLRDHKDRGGLETGNLRKQFKNSEKFAVIFQKRKQQETRKTRK